MNAPLKCFKCGKVKKHEQFFRLSPDMGGEETGKVIIICLDCLKLADKRKFREMENLVSKEADFCFIHEKKKDTFIINKEKKWERYCYFCEKEKWANSLQRLNVNPFSLAKYFYERGVEDIAIIQKLIYLTYVEVLEKENILLDFGEDFQAWDGGPVIESVFSVMSRDWDKCGNYEKTLENIPVLNEDKIIRHCENWIKFFKKIEKKKQHYKISRASQNQPWMIARSKVSNFLDHEKIEIDDIINFVKNGNSSKGEQLKL